MATALQDQIDARATAFDKMKEINDRSKGGALSGEDEQAYQRANDDYEKFDAIIEREQALAKREQALKAVDIHDDPTEGGKPTERDVDPKDPKAKAAKEYRDAFLRLVRFGENKITAAERDRLAAGYGDIAKTDEERALGVGGDSAGGYTVPDEFRNRIVETLKAYGGMLDWAMPLNTGTGAKIEWPTVDDTASEGALIGENTDDTDLDIAFGSAQLDAYTYTSRTVKVSWLLLQDSATDVEALLVKLLTLRLYRIMSRHATVGTGTNQPDGIMTSAPVGLVTASPTAVTADEVIDMTYTLDDAYAGLTDIGWMLNKTFQREVRKLKDGNQQYIWVPGLTAGDPTTLAGHPVKRNPYVASIAASAKVAGFGSISEAYVWRTVRDMQLVVARELYSNKRQTGFNLWARADGTLQDGNAFKTLQMHA